jgi:hypothetical protein
VKEKKMTEDEKTTIMLRCVELENQGRKDEARKLFKQIPLPPWLAKSAKESMGADFLITQGYDLSEANKAYGTGWLAK